MLFRSIDYKTGRGPHTFAEHADQVTFASVVTGAPDAAVVWVTPEGVRVDREQVTAFARARLVHRLRELLDALPSAQPTPGLHCSELHCPARPACPATQAVLTVAAAPTDVRRRLPLVGPVESHEDAHALLVALPLIEAWAKERAAAAKLFADTSGGVRGPDGRVYRGRDEVRETAALDRPGAMDALRRALGDDGAAAVVEHSPRLTWTRLEQWEIGRAHV